MRLVHCAWSSNTVCNTFSKSVYCHYSGVGTRGAGGPLAPPMIQQGGPGPPKNRYIIYYIMCVFWLCWFYYSLLYNVVLVHPSQYTLPPPHTKLVYCTAIKLPENKVTYGMLVIIVIISSKKKTTLLCGLVVKQLVSSETNVQYLAM